jgi:hypothetical protein
MDREERESRRAGLAIVLAVLVALPEGWLVYLFAAALFGWWPF